MLNSQLECLVELRCPAVVLRLCGELALLISQEGADHGNLNERPKHPRCLPLHVVNGDDWMERYDRGRTGEHKYKYVHYCEINFVSGTVGGLRATKNTTKAV